MRCLSVVMLLLAVSLASAAEPAWTDLLAKDSLEAFKPTKAKEGDFVWADSVALKKVDENEKDPAKRKLDEKFLSLKPGKGILVNGEKGRSPDLYTKADHGDCEVHVEFLLGKGSNSGVKFHGHYEIQIIDSFGKDKLTGDTCGGVYPRADAQPKYHHIDDGIAPKVNACRKPGEWQEMDIIFLAPRFDAEGKKTANAKILRATLNGQVIHDNTEMKTPTGNNYGKKEMAKGPFMIQMDHGPVAFRNVKMREYAAK